MYRGFQTDPNERRHLRGAACENMILHFSSLNPPLQKVGQDDGR